MAQWLEGRWFRRSFLRNPSSVTFQLDMLSTSPEPRTSCAFKILPITISQYRPQENTPMTSTIAFKKTEPPHLHFNPDTAPFSTSE